MRVIAFLFLLALTAPGCTKKEQLTNDNFNTKAFFAAETGRLEKSKHGIIKTLMFNNETRQLIIEDTVNWQQELAPFTEIDLSSDVFSQAFLVDTIMNGSSAKITYMGKDEKMELKSVVILLENNKLVRISYELYTKNSLYANRKLLVYMPDNGYRITGFQKVNLLSGSDFSIHVKWMN
ncbi:MAG: hypothetical protein V4658_03965 [Bacteroidota bacterium]